MDVCGLPVNITAFRKKKQPSFNIFRNIYQIEARPRFERRVNVRFTCNARKREIRNDNDGGGL